MAGRRSVFRDFQALPSGGAFLWAERAILRREVPGYDARVAEERARLEVEKVRPGKRQGGTGANQHNKAQGSKGDNVTSATGSRGNSKSYLLSRLKRDHPEIAHARRQADPEDPEFVRPQGGRKPDNETASNTKRLRGSVDKPGTLRRLARSRPDLLAGLPHTGSGCTTRPDTDTRPETETRPSATRCTHSSASPSPGINASRSWASSRAGSSAVSSAVSDTAIR